MFVLPLILGLIACHTSGSTAQIVCSLLNIGFRSCWSLRSLILMASGVELAFAA